MDREAEDPALEVKQRQATGSVAKAITRAAGWEVLWEASSGLWSLIWEFSEGRGSGE